MEGVDRYVPGPNAEKIRYHCTRVIKGRVPSGVRKELREAVKAGYLGHLKKDGLKPEIFFHPDHKHGAVERQKREAEYAVKCILGVVAHGAERAEHDINQLRKLDTHERDEREHLLDTYKLALGLATED